MLKTNHEQTLSRYLGKNQCIFLNIYDSMISQSLITQKFFLPYMHYNAYIGQDNGTGWDSPPKKKFQNQIHL